MRLLRSEGLTHREVAERLGISRSYASALAVDPDGAKDRARKDSYAGVCVDCGAATTGSDGRDAAPERCDDCRRARQHEEKWFPAVAEFEGMDPLRPRARLSGPFERLPVSVEVE